MLSAVIAPMVGLLELMSEPVVRYAGSGWGECHSVCVGRDWCVFDDGIGGGVNHCHVSGGTRNVGARSVRAYRNAVWVIDP